jgi:hypothetical protein
MEPELPPAFGQPSLASLLAAVRQAHPSLDEALVRRHGQLRRLYARAVQQSRVACTGKCGIGHADHDTCTHTYTHSYTATRTPPAYTRVLVAIFVRR